MEEGSGERTPNPLDNSHSEPTHRTTICIGPNRTRIDSLVEIDSQLLTHAAYIHVRLLNVVVRDAHRHNCIAITAVSVARRHCGL